jgi:hypothetical protein
MRWGLPVEDEEYENLCLHASARLEDLVFKPLKFLPGSNVIVRPIQKLVGPLVGQLAKRFPQYFCGGSPAGGFASLGGAFADIAKKGIAKVAADVCQEVTKGARIDPLALPSCTAGVSANVTSVAAGSALGGSKQTSKRIHRPADLGGDYYASYGFVFSRYFEKHDVDPALGVANAGNVPPEVLRTQLDRLLAQTQFSRSEFYYDPRASAAGGTSWTAPLGSKQSALRDEALLNMRWRARLRRYHPPAPSTAGLLAGSGLGAILRSIRSPAPGMNPAAMVTTILGRDPEELAAWLDHRVGHATSRGTAGVFH